MDAAAGIIVVRGLRGQDGTVRVPGDQNAAVFLRPLVQADFAIVFYMIIFGGAGRVEDSQIFQGPPDIADEETGQSVEFKRLA